MRMLLGLLAVACALHVGPAMAQDAAKSAPIRTAAEAQKKTVSPAAQPPAPPKVASAPSQQNRMRECNKAATGKKGDDRKAFMKSCLSGKA